mgnify:CR=1 FL=1
MRGGVVDEDALVIAGAGDGKIAAAGEGLIIIRRLETGLAAEEELLVAEVGGVERLRAVVKDAGEELVVEVEDPRIDQVGAEVARLAVGARGIAGAAQRAAWAAGGRRLAV